MRALERQRDQGSLRKVGERWTVGRWLTHWVDNIAAPPHVAENTHLGYKVDVRNHLAELSWLARDRPVFGLFRRCFRRFALYYPGQRLGA